ncbi:SDR family NAD(P)-dependent oxidoreductase [Bordetella trematum]|uniref:SDR family NAD(P)-dependent oxidoreductase n=1 Tax=Bordetella trematum TaxID=123899 RepID=UPI0015583EBC|nr:SDR family oxidoreductase [Bordetella trematum]
MEKLNSLIDLSGKVAVVTGAAGGIGARIVQTLRAAGATVVPTDIQPQPGQDDFTTLDVGEVAQIDALAATVAQRHGRLDIWVSNAGMLARSPALELTPQAWDRSLNVNLRSAVFGARAAARHMAPGGAIVNLSSYAGLKARPNCVDYAAAKAGVHHATKCLALEFGERGVRVNAIAPGYIDTVMSSWMHADAALRDQYLAKIPLGRLGEPQEVANGVLYLVSPLSSYVTGHTLVIDGGCMHG